MRTPRQHKSATISLVLSLLAVMSTYETDAGCNLPRRGPEFTVSLIQVGSNAPLSPPNRICSNSKPEYKQVKYKIITTPTVAVNFDANVTGTAGGYFADTGTPSKSAVPNGTILTVTVPDYANGTWVLSVGASGVWDASDPQCKATVGEDAFYFMLNASEYEEFRDTKRASSGDWATWDYVPGLAEAKDQDQVSRPRYAWVTTIPSGEYAGKVKCKVTSAVLCNTEVTISSTEEIRRTSASLVAAATSGFTLPLTPFGGDFNVGSVLTGITSGGGVSSGISLVNDDTNGDIIGPSQHTRLSFPAGELAPDPEYGTHNPRIEAVRTFNLGVSPAEKVKVVIGNGTVAAGIPSGGHKARAVVESSKITYWMVDGDEWLPVP